MSRTDAHLPHHALLNDPKLAKESHDHREGPCDLLTLKKWMNLYTSTNWATLRKYHCRWDVDWTYFYDHHMCGCSMCTSKIWRKQEIKRKRAAKASEITEQLLSDTEEPFQCEDCGECTAWQCRGDANYYIGRDYPDEKYEGTYKNLFLDKHPNL